MICCKCCDGIDVQSCFNCFGLSTIIRTEDFLEKYFPFGIGGGNYSLFR